jgi:hypothetical protein
MVECRKCSGFQPENDREIIFSNPIVIAIENFLTDHSGACRFVRAQKSGDYSAGSGAADDGEVVQWVVIGRDSTQRVITPLVKNGPSKNLKWRWESSQKRKPMRH